jgi:hypothetical protein
MSIRKILVMAASAAAVVGVVATAAPAGAVEGNGVVEPGELGLYYLSNLRPPLYDMYYSDPNLHDEYFVGTNITVGDNTESAWNNDTYYWSLYTGINYTGSCGYISPGVSGNLAGTWNNGVSSARYSSTPC